MAQTLVTFEELPGLAGRDLGRSEWLEITQERIQQFADATDDQQWIHVDAEGNDEKQIADIATADVLNDPAGWLRLVPTHWQPGAWLDCYRTAYVVAWAERAAEA